MNNSSAGEDQASNDHYYRTTNEKSHSVVAYAVFCTIIGFVIMCLLMLKAWRSSETT
jgi:hypothetical protein